MTLKEKFDTISCKDCNMPYCDVKCTILVPNDLDKLEQIADDFAIGFAEWVVKTNNFLDYGYDEALKIYKKAKEL